MKNVTLLLAIALFTTAAGCGGRGGGLIQRGVINHPLTSGGMAPAAPIAFMDPDQERHLGVPTGVLTDEAVMVRADVQQICFDVTVRVSEEESQWSDLSAYRMQILSSSAETPLEGPMISPRQVAAAQFPGHRYEQIPTGATTTTCVSQDQYGNCTEYRTDPVMQTITVPHTWTVLQGGGVACFANAGVLTPSTTWLRFRLLDPRNPGGRRGFVRDVRVGLNFEWELAGAAPAQPAAQQPPQGS